MAIRTSGRLDDDFASTTRCRWLARASARATRLSGLGDDALSACPTALACPRQRSLSANAALVEGRNGGACLSWRLWARLEKKNRQPGTTGPTLAAAWAGPLELMGALWKLPQFADVVLDHVTVERELRFDR